MFHAITADLRHIVGQEGVGAIVEGRRGAEDGDFLRHDLLRHGGEAIEVG